MKKNKEKIPVKCPSCDWSWTYTGNKKIDRAYIVCPQCRKATKLIVLKRYYELTDLEVIDDENN
jgi:acetyl-CoA carboxylase beta subunit